MSPILRDCQEAQMVHGLLTLTNRAKRKRKCKTDDHFFLVCGSLEIFGELVLPCPSFTFTHITNFCQHICFESCEETKFAKCTLQRFLAQNV